MNIGLVLAGGMAKGAYQIGALRALESFVPLEEIKYVSCASVGVLNGYAYATGQLDLAEQMWRGLCDEETRLIITQVLRSSILQRCIVDLYDPKKPLFPKAFFSVLLDITHKNTVYKNLTSVCPDQIPRFLKASVAMPVYNRAVQIEDISYFDGAMIDNIPVFPLLEPELDYVICVYFDDTCFKFECSEFDNKVIKITFPTENRLKQSLFFRKSMIEEMIQKGYDVTSEILKTVLAGGYDNLEHIYTAIKHMKENNKSNNLRLTGDVMVTNLNKITQKLTKKQIL